MLQTAVTGKVKPGSKAAKRRKSFCARSKGWTGETVLQAMLQTYYFVFLILA